MYRPKYSIHEDQALAIQLIQDFPLGLLITNSTLQDSTEQTFTEAIVEESKNISFQTCRNIEINYLPFIIVKENTELFLMSHLAKNNPQWRKLKGEVLISFLGSNRYISPLIYLSKLNVPTWSYSAVQVKGKVELITEKNYIKELLNKSIQIFEEKNKTNWNNNLPQDISEKLETAIVGIKIKITSIEAKHKLSQNRNSEDYNSVLNFLKNSKSQNDLELYNWMKKVQL